MDLRSIRKSLELTLQAAGEAVGVTREAVRLAEAGRAPDAASKLEKHYKQVLRKKARKQMREPNTKITFEFARRKDGKIVLRSLSERPFEISDRLIDALLDGFNKGATIASAVEI